MTIFNLTNDPSLMPTGEAIDLVRDILSAPGYDVPPFYVIFNGNPLFRTHVYGYECTEYEFSERIPLFIVNKEISGRKVYNRILQREIPVPKDLLPNIKISELFEVKDNKNTEKGGREDRDYRDERSKETAHLIVDEKIQFIDVWGIFTILHDNTNRTEMPAIFIWMDKIQEAVNHDRNTEWLFAKVYVHELAHALMHTGYYSNDDFYKWREESLANAYALSKINSYIFGCNDDDHPYPHLYALNKYHKDYGLLDFAKSVMRKQPDNYKLGIKIFENLCGHHGCYEIYRLMRNWMRIKDKQSLPPKELQEEWLKAVQTPNKLDGKILYKLDRYMGSKCYKYNGNYYFTDYNVVLQVIKDYVKDHPGITSADLNIAFPATLNLKYNVFATWPQAANYDEQESLFKKNTPNYNHYNRNEDCIINLADGRLVVCDGWDEDDFKNFVENANNLGYDIEILVD